MAKNKIITSEGNVQFQLGDGSGKIINVHPFHIYSVFNEDTVSFILIAMPKSSGLAIFTSKAEDLEVNGTTYTFAELPDALAEAFAVAGAQARAEIVDELPETGQTNTIYLVPKEDGQGFDEYIYVDGQWELLGDTDIELDRYVEKTDFSAYTAATDAKINTISGDVATVSGQVASEVTRATDAEGALDTKIDTVSGNVITETSRAESAETALDDKIDTVSGNVITETSRAESAETALDDKIGVVSGAVDDVQDEVDILSAALDDEVSARTDADSALQTLIDTVSGDVETLTANVETISGDVATISGSVESLGDDKANKAEAVASAEYVSSSTTIDLKDISGNVISQVDASDFIIDGMIDDVKIENGYLIIDFNTASGKEDIQIPLTDIFDPSNYYDKTAIDNIVSGLNDSIDTKLDATAYTPTDLSNYYTKSETSGATEIQNALDGKANSGDVKTFVAGRGISITTGETGDTIAFNLPVYLSGSSAVAIGQPIGRTQYDNKVSGFSATAIGAGLNSLNSYETATGVHNIQRTTSNTFGNSGSTLFTIGNGGGDGSTYRHNALEVRQNGDIYIADTNDTSHSEFYKKPMIKLQDALGQGGISSGEVQTMIDNSISGKTNQSDFETYSGAVESRIAEDEEVTAAGLNALNESLSGKQDTLIAGDNITISGNVISASGGGSTYTAGRGIDITSGVISFSLPISAGTGSDSIAEGKFTNANGWGAHAEGNYTNANGNYSHAEGSNTTASSIASHAEGGGTIASGNYSHAEGSETRASGNYSHAEGVGVTAINFAEHASGRYNNSVSASPTFGDSGNTLFSVGNGTSDSARHNAFEIRQNGDIYLTKDGQDVKLQDQLGGSSITVDTVLDSGSTNPVENRVIYNKIDEVEEVTAASLNALNDKFGGLKLVSLSQAEYNALATKDSSTLYIIVN